MNTLWDDLANRAALTLSAAQHDRLARYLDLLLEANQTMNLTRLTDRAEAESLYIGDALTLLPLLPPGKLKIADVGSGGGTPGFPLAIARPDAQVTCIESTGKKAAFLQQTAAALDLQNVRVLATRAEDVAHGQARASFDVVAAKALGRLIWVAEWCLPLAKIGGKVLAMKGAKAAEELAESQKAIHLLGGKPAVIHPVQLPGADQHVIVEIPKVKLTPKHFPRLPTHAKGKPLR